VTEVPGAYSESTDETSLIKIEDAAPIPYARGESVGDKSFRDYIAGRVFIVTGAGGRFLHPEAIEVVELTFLGKGRGLGLVMAEGLVEAGGMGEHPFNTGLDGR
jgi:hypothetical protein